MSSKAPETATLADVILSTSPELAEVREKAVSLLKSNPALAVQVALECQTKKGKRAVENLICLLKE